MSTFYTTPEEVAKRLSDSLKAQMEDLIKRELMKHADEIVSHVARELAHATSTLIVAHESRHDHLTPKIEVKLIFNNQQVETYVKEK